MVLAAKCSNVNLLGNIINGIVCSKAVVRGVAGKIQYIGRKMPEYAQWAYNPGWP
jgi:hypothetical protein